MNHLFTFVKTCLLFSILIFVQKNTTAGTFTAIASGNYNSPATWQGGIAPGFSLTNDIIVIPPGIMVTLSSNLAISGIASSLTVNGDLNATSNAIDVNGITMAGSGIINVDSFSGAFPGQFDYNGTINVNKLNLSFNTIIGNPTIDVAKVFYVLTPIMLTNGKINLTNGTRLVIAGMSGNPIPSPISVSGGGSLGLLAPYSVEYINGSMESGLELSGPGLKDVTVDVGTGEEVKLTTIAKILGGTLKLVSGTLNLNSNDLEFNASGNLDPAGQGTIKAGSSSDVLVNTATAITGALKFATGGNILQNLVINTSGNVKIANDLKVTNKVDLKSGKVDIQGNKLSLITGAEVTGADASKYIITGNGGKLSDDVGADDSTTYHIGTETQYAPCMVKSNNNTVYNGLSIGVNEGVKSLATSGTLMSAAQPMVNATWFLENGTAAVVDFDLELMWGAGLEVNSFDRNKSYITQLQDATWDKLTGKAATTTGSMYSNRRTGVKKFTAAAVFDDATVGIKNVASNNTINMYPNPASNVLYIDVNEQSQATIVNMSGSVMSNALLSTHNKKIDISNIPAGIYYLHLTGKYTNATGKFVKH